MDSIMKNKTWELVDPPKNKKIIGCRWIFKTKYNESGNPDIYKARLVAKGFNQTFGNDYEETYAPTPTYRTLRALLVAASYKNLPVVHLDVKTAFLHGELEEEIFMQQPEGYVKSGQEGKVCKLKKALYGLKQAAKAWNSKFTKFLCSIGFKQSTADCCLFVKNNEKSSIYLLLYVDDILLSGTTKDIEDTMNKISQEFEIKVLGNVRHYLGIDIQRNEEGQIMISQSNKIRELSKRFNLSNAKPVYTPMETGYTKDNNKSKLLATNKQFKAIIGSLLYIAEISRPDITAAVNILSRKSEAPTVKDFNAAKRVICYLQTTINKHIVLSAHSVNLTGFVDADYAGDLDDRKSTGGYIFLLDGSPISWKTKKQTCVALSTTEAEIVSLSEGLKEATWLIKLLTDLNMKPSLPLQIFCDNQAAIKLAQTNKNKSRTKHIDVRLSHMKDLQDQQQVTIEYCSTEDMLADIFTKALPRPRLQKLSHQLGLTEAST